MGFELHPTFKAPLNENQKIWRYMDLSKFISLIEDSALYLCRIDKYHNIDPFEGSLPRSNIQAKGINIFNLDSNRKEFKSFEVDPHYLQLHNFNINRIKAWKNFIYSSSWFMQDSESNVMWETYANSDGIAIQSTYKALKECITDNKKVFIGEINYLDFENDVVTEISGFEPFVIKRKNFSQEKELRVIYWDAESLRLAAEKYGAEHNDIQYNTQNNLFTNLGHKIDVNLNILVENIYLSPFAANWQVDTYKTLIKKYGIDKPVYSSDILKDSYMPK